MIPLAAFVLLLAAPRGDVYVADANTLVMSGTAVRLEGIRVPPPNSAQGEAAADKLRDLVDGKLVTCRMENTFLSSFATGSCRADGQDIASAMIAAGHAEACTSGEGCARP